MSEYFAKLELTIKRLELIQILADLYSEIPNAKTARQVTYLLQGRVAAFYEPVEFGLADRLMERSIAQALGCELRLVEQKSKETGDLGKSIEQLHEMSETSTTKLKVTDVFEVLEQITATSGEGSVERKIDLLSGLLKQASAMESKYIVRIVSGTLRLGVGDVTVLEALAQAKLDDRKLRGELERVYNEVSDLGEIAEVLYEVDSVEERVNKVRGMKLRVGRPLRSELCERLPNAEKTISKMGEVVAQFKYDGFRTQMHLDRKQNVVRLFSRNLEETTHAFPELRAALLSQVDAESVILDAEAIAYLAESDEFLPFQETTKRRRKHDIEEVAEKLPLRAFVFDILYLNGESMLEKPVTERMKILRAVIKGEVEEETLIVSESRIIAQSEELQLMLDEALTKRLEGVVLKKVDSPYEAGARNFNWVKLKHTASSHMRDTIDCVVLGYIFGRGKRTTFGVGALLVGVYDKNRDMFVSISKIGTGLADREWIEVRERCDKLQSTLRPARVESEIVPSVWVEPGVVIEVLCDEITRSPLHTAGRTLEEPGYALRFPRLISFRDADKRAEDATTVEEIIELYKMQGQ